jgi:Caspase domain
MRTVAAFACAVMLVSLAAGPGNAQTRVALVIGNSAYQNVPALPNPTSDASDVAASLERLGFAVRRVTNGTFDEMRRALRDFAAQAGRAEMAVVFFAGHGMEIGGENWLIPVDAELKLDVAADQEAVALRSILPIVGGASKLGLAILDACRNNPFSSRMQRSLPTRAVDRGLVRVEPTGTVLVAYAARDGTTANDGTGRNSPFTAALLKNLETPGLEINYLFRSVREEVFSTTSPHQEPVVYGALPKAEIYLKPLSGPLRPDDGQPTGDAAVRAWAEVRDTKSQAVLEAFIKRYADSFYADIAHARLEELKKSQVPAGQVAPPMMRPPPPVAHAAPPPPVMHAPPPPPRVVRTAPPPPPAAAARPAAPGCPPGKSLQVVNGLHVCG